MAMAASPHHPPAYHLPYSSPGPERPNSTIISLTTYLFNLPYSNMPIFFSTSSGVPIRCLVSLSYSSYHCIAHLTRDWGKKSEKTRGARCLPRTKENVNRASCSHLTNVVGFLKYHPDPSNSHFEVLIQKKKSNFIQDCESIRNKRKYLFE